MLPTTLVLASAAVTLTLGLVHLLYTFRGTKLHPRDPAARDAMQRAHLGLTTETTVWRAYDRTTEDTESTEND